MELTVINAMKLNIGNGQSYENVSILTISEIRERGMDRLFGVATFCFKYREDFYFVHVNNVNVIHFNKSRPQPDGSFPYTKIVMADDAVYSGGHILTQEHQADFGIDDIIVADEWNRPLLFTANPEGLIMVGSQYVATLKCDAVLPAAPIRLRSFDARPKR